MLGLSRLAGTEQIKEQFRKLAFKYHPDMGSTLKELEQEREKSEKFIAIKEAYEVLQNPESKRLYDAFIGNTKQEAQ